MRVLLSLAAGCYASREADSARDHSLAVEPFAYPDGPLFGQSGGSGWTSSSIWTGSGTEVTGGEAIGVSGVGWTASRSFDNPGTSSLLFVSLVLRTPASVPLDDSFAVVLGAGVNFSNLVIGKGPGEAVFSVGSSGFFFPSSVSVLPDTTYHLVGAYDLVNQRVSLDRTSTTPRAERTASTSRPRAPSPST